MEAAPIPVGEIWMGEHPDAQEDQRHGTVGASAIDNNEVALNALAENDAACSVYLTAVQAVQLSERLRQAAEGAIGHGTN